MTIKEPYVSGQRYGDFFKQMLLGIKAGMVKKDTNCTIMCFGPIGAGKSTLGFHAYDVYSEGNVDLKRVGFNVTSNAQALDRARKQKGSFCLFDELNLSRRAAMSEYNKDFLDVFFKIRGKRMCVWANNPSLHYIDKVFVEEALVNVFIFIHVKQLRYYWFTFEDMVRLLREQGDLKYNTIKRYGKKYATFDGYFFKFNKPVWQDYLALKEEGMDDVLDRFTEKWGKGERYTLTDAARMLGVSRVTITKYYKLAVAQGVLPADTKGLNGTHGLFREQIDDFRDFILKNSFVGGTS